MERSRRASPRISRDLMEIPRKINDTIYDLYTNRIEKEVLEYEIP